MWSIEEKEVAGVGEGRGCAWQQEWQEWVEAAG